MLVVIFVTSLVTIILLIVTSTSYLITLIYNEAEDLGPIEQSDIDPRDFDTAPVSPYELAGSQNLICTNPAHRHCCVKEQSDRRASIANPVATESQSQDGLTANIPSKPAVSEIVASPAANIPDDNVQHPEPIEAVPEPSVWTGASQNAQKNLIASQFGPVATRQIFDDFDAKEMQLGGSPLHWCKSRISLDRLIKIGIPLNLTNKRNETALHVAVRRRKLQVLIGLLCYGAELEHKNHSGETALIVASRVNDVFACQLLLVFDVNYDAVDNLGQSARHYAAASCDKHKTTQSSPSANCLILAMLNEIGAKRCSAERSARRALTEDSENCQAKKKPPVSSCTDGCSISGKYNGNNYNRWASYNLESLYKRHMFCDIIKDRRLRESDESGNPGDLEDSEKEKPTRSRLLCIDGGGMRGVIVCQMLIEMEKYLKQPVLSYFDWIGGTSVGAFVSCALCTGSSLQELRRISFDVKDEVFSGTRPYNSKFLERVLKRTYGPATRMSDVRGKKLAVTTVIADRDPCQLRMFRNYESVNDVLEAYGYSPELFNNISPHSIVARRSISSQASKKTTGSASSKIASKSTIRDRKVQAPLRGISVSTNSVSLSSDGVKRSEITTAKVLPDESLIQTIKSESDSLDNVTSLDSASLSKKESLLDYVIDENDQDPIMWQAVRASAAAPFFFKPYGPYLDGGIISNNPTIDMLNEFHSHESLKAFLRRRVGDESTLNPQAKCLNIHRETPRKLDLVVSLGTGRSRVVGRRAMIDFGQVASGFATVFSPVELLRSIRAARDLFKKVIQQSCQTEEHIIDRAQAWCASIGTPYFRINPPLASIFSIDDKRDEQLINALWQTKLYMKAMAPQLRELGEIMDGPGGKR